MAEDIFDKVKRAEKEISRIIDLDRARISIGATSVIGEPLLPKLMKGFKLTKRLNMILQLLKNHGF